MVTVWLHIFPTVEGEIIKKGSGDNKKRLGKPGQRADKAPRFSTQKLKVKGENCMLVVRNQWRLLQHFRPCGPTGRLVCKTKMNANEFAVALAAGAFTGLAFGTWRQKGLCTTSKGLHPPVPPDVRDVCACVVAVCFLCTSLSFLLSFIFLIVCAFFMSPNVSDI